MTVAGVATRWPFTHTAAAPTTPLTTSWARRPGRSRELKLVRHHHGTANIGTVTLPIWFM